MTQINYRIGTERKQGVFIRPCSKCGTVPKPMQLNFMGKQFIYVQCARCRDFMPLNLDDWNEANEPKEPV